MLIHVQLREHKQKLHKKYLLSWHDSIFDYKLRANLEELWLKIL